MMMPTLRWSRKMLLSMSILLVSTGSSSAFLVSPSQHSIPPVAAASKLTTPTCLPLTTTVAAFRDSDNSRPQSFLQATNSNNNEMEQQTSALQFNPLYGALWLAFLGYGIFFSPGELWDPADTKMIEDFINDPSNASGAMNPLFYAVFNALGIMPIVMAQLILPQGRKEGVPAAPFVLGSFGAGFGAVGLYLTLRAPPVDTKSKAEASWITANVLDNKIANWSVVALCGSLLVTSGILSSPDGVSGVVESYQQLAATSKFVSVSSVDLLILTIAAATLIPQDFRLRQTEDNEDESNISLIAASTVLLPVVGAALYCALRPPLPEE